MFQIYDIEATFLIFNDGNKVKQLHQTKQTALSSNHV
jgi:hypothetical protein